MKRRYNDDASGLPLPPSGGSASGGADGGGRALWRGAHPPVDESVETALADSLDYYYVPTFYVDGVKRMEGVPSRRRCAVLDAALAE